jgi:hypothetical protein
MNQTEEWLYKKAKEVDSELEYTVAGAWVMDWLEEYHKEQLILSGVVKSLKVKDLMTFEDYKNNLFIKSDGVYQPKKTKLFRWYSEKQLKKMYKDKPL